MSHHPRPWAIGPTIAENGRCQFDVWAPFAKTAELVIEPPARRQAPMQMAARGHFLADVEGVARGSNYFYLLNGEVRRPDPASRFQPQGVHGPSQLVSPHFNWTDSAWAGVPLEAVVFYEIHVGTFTAEGTFESIIPRLPALKSLGITMIELMPVAQFPGSRNWGYDGVFPYAVQSSYGGPDGLKRLVDACHREGLGVALDVVYNHLGPEGNYLRDFGPYFTDRYKTPWGEALNFDGPESDEVRRFFIGNATYWVSEFHIDALRLDAVHAIVDTSATPFIEELALEVHQLAGELGRPVHVIAESDLNDPHIVQSREIGGRSFDAQWSDDFHHALHTLLTREKMGYYEDFGSIEHLAKAYSQGFVYSGEYSPFRRRRHGNSSQLIPARRFVVFAQNHDQVGNRAQGDRLSSIVSFEKLKLAAAALFLSPFLPLLFMGEEYGELAPFPYFVSHSDAELIENVRKGRREEFAKFAWSGSVPDPQAQETFELARLNWNLRDTGKHQILLSLYTELLRLRRSIPVLANLSKLDMNTWTYGPNAFGIERWSGNDRVSALFNFDDRPAPVCARIAARNWTVILDSADARWLGSGSLVPRTLPVAGESLNVEMPPLSFVILRRSQEESSIAPSA
jgi:maltooligosyltrehalose trehalohydrolase